MAPHLKPEVIAAIETAVECNDGQLESAFIHALAKIYKTSPQAVVWNMKRYNKVKAGVDDRKKNGRHAVMDKEKAAEFVRELEAKDPGLKYEKISDALFEKFDVRVSTTWVLRLIKKHDIPNRRPQPVAPPKRNRIRKETRRREANKETSAPPPPPPPPNPAVQLVDLNKVYISDPSHYPSFRQDLQQAMDGNPATPKVPLTQHMLPVTVYHSPPIAGPQPHQPQQPQQPPQAAQAVQIAKPPQPQHPQQPSQAAQAVQTAEPPRPQHPQHPQHLQHPQQLQAAQTAGPPRSQHPQPPSQAAQAVQAVQTAEPPRPSEPSQPVQIQEQQPHQTPLPNQNLQQQMQQTQTLAEGRPQSGPIDTRPIDTPMKESRRLPPPTPGSSILKNLAGVPSSKPPQREFVWKMVNIKKRL